MHHSTGGLIMQLCIGDTAIWELAQNADVVYKCITGINDLSDRVGVVDVPLNYATAIALLNLRLAAFAHQKYGLQIVAE